MARIKIALRLVTAVLICGLLLSGAVIPSYAIADPSDSALAPPLVTKPPCEIIQKSDGSFDVVTNNDVIESWDRETARSVGSGEILGKAFRNRWAFVDVSYLIGQMLILTQEHKLQNPKDILIPLIKKHIRNRDGEAEILLEGYDLDGIKELREGNEIIGFSLPVTRNGTPAYQLVYNLRGGDIAIQMRDGNSVYVATELVASRQEIDKSSIADIFPQNDYLAYLILYMTRLLSPSEESEDVGKGMVSLSQRLNKGFREDFVRRQKSSSDDVKSCYLWFAQLVKDNLGTAKELLPLVRYPSHKRNMIEAVPDAENFVNGIEMLLDESVKQVGINDTLEKMLNLTFSKYYRNRGAKHAISKYLSSDVPTIFARQDEIAYLFFSLVLPLQWTKEVTLTASTQLISDKAEKHIVITIATSQEVALKNVTTYPDKDTGIGFELAKRVVRKYSGTIDVQSEVGKGTTFTIRLPIASASGKTEDTSKTTTTAVAISPETERIHTTNVKDTLTYIQAQPQTQPIVVALGTSWIKGYEKGRYLQYDALNPLIGNIRSYCESKGIPFLVDDDDKLLARINAERAKEGRAGAKVVVLAGKDTVASDEFTTLRNDQKNAFVVGVDNQELTTDSYIRLMEMLTLALKLSAGLEISLDNTHITITKDNELHLYIFLPHAEPMDYERLKVIYEVQKFA